MVDKVIFWGAALSLCSLQGVHRLFDVSLSVAVFGLTGGLHGVHQRPAGLGGCIVCVTVQGAIKLTAGGFEILCLEAFHAAHDVVRGIVFRCATACDLYLLGTSP